MSRQVFRNNVFTKLAGAITDDQTVFQVADGSVFYSPGANEHAVITLQSKNIRSQVEVVQLVSVSGNTITVVRGIEGAQFAFAANDVVEQRVTAGSLDNFLQTEDVATSDTPPVNPRKDQRWIDSTDGAEYFWYDNGTSQQWVEVGTQVYGTDPAPPPAVTAYDMYQDQQAALISAVANTALSDAATAQSTADTALSDAATAQGTANTALSNAAAAQSTANTALSNAATAQGTADTADGKADNNSACLGVSNAAHMGAFSGALFPDNQPVKPLLQIAETRLERAYQVFNFVLNGSTGTPSGGTNGVTFNNVNDILAACPNYCTINIEVEGFLGVWNPLLSVVEKVGCEINININYNGDAQKQGITSTLVTGANHCELNNCVLYITGEQTAYSIIRSVAGASGMFYNGLTLNGTPVICSNVTFEFANSANFAGGGQFKVFNQEVGNARMFNCFVKWDPVFAPVPVSLSILGAISSVPNYYDHDTDMSYIGFASATETNVFVGPANRKFMSGALSMPASPGTGGKVIIPLSYPMQNITNARLRLVCTAVGGWGSFAQGAELIIALGGSSGAEGNEKGLYFACDRAGTKLIQNIWIFVGDQGATHVRNLAPYSVVSLDFSKFDTFLICRDDS